MEEIRKVKVKINELSRVVEDLENKIIDSCEHELEKEECDTIRDNGEFHYRCRKCNFLST